jgi:hypothetical protein
MAAPATGDAVAAAVARSLAWSGSGALAGPAGPQPVRVPGTAPVGGTGASVAEPARTEAVAAAAAGPPEWTGSGPLPEAKTLQPGRLRGTAPGGGRGIPGVDPATSESVVTAAAGAGMAEAATVDAVVAAAAGAPGSSGSGALAGPGVPRPMRPSSRAPEGGPRVPAGAGSAGLGGEGGTTTVPLPAVGFGPGGVGLEPEPAAGGPRRDGPRSGRVPGGPGPGPGAGAAAPVASGPGGSGPGAPGAALVTVEGQGGRAHGFYLGRGSVLTLGRVLGGSSLARVRTADGFETWGVVEHAPPRGELVLLHVERAGRALPLAAAGSPLPADPLPAAGLPLWAGGAVVGVSLDPLAGRAADAAELARLLAGLKGP